MTTRQNPPEEITLLYRKVGDTHVFTAPDLPGLHIGSAGLDTAFRLAIQALGEHVSRVYGCEAEYEAEISFWDFANHLENKSDLLSPFVIAKRAEIRASA